MIYVVAHKPTLRASAAMRADGEMFYHWMTWLLLERVAHETRGSTGGARVARVRLGAVKGMDHARSQAYLSGTRDRDQGSVPWEHLYWPPKWHGTDEYDGIQLADIYLGMFRAALVGDAQDMLCAEMLLQHRHQIRRSTDGRLLGFGIKVYGQSAFLCDRVWWPELHS